MTSPVTEGADAANGGWPVSASPYRPGTVEHSQWVGGWTAATIDLRFASGQIVRDTLDQRAVVTQHMGSMREYQTDPAQEILDRAAREARYERFVANMAEAARAIGVAMADLAHVLHRLHRSAHGLTPPLGVVTHADATTAARSVVQRRKHGSASVCPRHGPTTGGFCRRCRP